MELTGTNRPTQHTNEHTSGTRSVPRTTPQAGVGVHYTVHDQPPPHTLVRTTPVHERAWDTREQNTGHAHHRDTTPHTPGGGTVARGSPDQARPGGHSGGATPGPIPNPEAKTPSADGTAPARVRKSRTPPGHHNTTTQEVPRSERVHMTRACSHQVPYCIVFSLTRGGAVR